MYTIVQLKGIIGQLKADWTTNVLNFLIGRLKFIIANRISKNLLLENGRSFQNIILTVSFQPNFAAKN